VHRYTDIHAIREKLNSFTVDSSAVFVASREGTRSKTVSLQRTGYRSLFGFLKIGFCAGSVTFSVALNVVYQKTVSMVNCIHVHEVLAVPSFVSEVSRPPSGKHTPKTTWPDLHSIVKVRCSSPILISLEEKKEDFLSIFFLSKRTSSLEEVLPHLAYRFITSDHMLRHTCN